MIDEIEIAEELAAKREMGAKKESATKKNPSSGNYKQYANKRWESGIHHWADDYRTHNKTTTCLQCGDIHHGEEFNFCEGCGAALSN